MSNTEAIGEMIDSVGFQSMEREEGSAKGLSAEAAAQAHLNGVKDALMEVAKLEVESVSRTTTQRGGKNSMITTFKIMKIVMETLRETSENGKEMSKALKKEWKSIADKQSENNTNSKENVESSGKWQYLSLAGSQAKLLFDKGGVPLLEGATALNQWAGGPLPAAIQDFIQKGIDNKESIKEILGGAQGQIGSAMGQLGKQAADMEQYNLGIKESVFQHEVQTHTSDYQNASQQQTSDSQAVDNAADTAKQLIRVQGEILMGKAG